MIEAHEMKARFNAGKHQLGKRPARTDKNVKTVQLLGHRETPTPALESSWVMKVPEMTMFGNDRLGDCVEAAAGHIENQVSLFAGGSEVTISDDDIIAFYSAAGGYVPGDPDTDNGTDMLTALNIWRQAGIGNSGHKILAYASVNPRNMTEVMQSIAIFGNLYIGIQLPP